jgi:homocysteine S-methyltransferase
MPKYRSALPQLEQGTKFLTDAGIETVLMFRHGVDLPHFAAVHLLNTEEGRQRLTTTAITINYVEEAIGITRAAVAEGMPVAISLTVETDGRLPTGQPLRDAIEQVDAETGNAPAYYMITCAHPTHFEHVLEAGTPWVQRIGGLRANASARSHAELDAATELDAGNPVELGAQYRALLKVLPNLEVLGGCCGTDVRHVSEIARACLP